MRPSRRWLISYAALVLAVPILSTQWAPLAPLHESDAERSALERRLRGSWWRHLGGGQGDPVRFYYFHGDGKGLYRYGRVGFTNTHSYDYRVERAEASGHGTLRIEFRKTGEVHHVHFALTRGEDGRDRLTLVEDPRETGETRYVRGGPPVDAERVVPFESREDVGSPAGHMWIDATRYATGGMGFHFYQFQGAAIDGRGIGWFHRGDFDEWSTEAFTYRLAGERLELDFSLRGERAGTRFRIAGKGDRRRLVLDRDPRDYWHHHEYVDAGRSFMGAEVVPTLVFSPSLRPD